MARECDYILEAQSQKRFRELLSGNEVFYVPKVIDEISSRKVLNLSFTPMKHIKQKERYESALFLDDQAMYWHVPAIGGVYSR